MREKIKTHYKSMNYTFWLILSIITILLHGVS